MSHGGSEVTVAMLDGHPPPALVVNHNADGRTGAQLLDGDGLGQVARLVDVQATLARDPIREQL
jgi:prepilin-type processing-associated H-X9-DG protein